jgi:hypothetical protein
MGRHRRVASRASWPLLAARALSGLLLVAAIAPGVARANAVVAPARPQGLTTTATPPAPSGAPGSVTRASATQLDNELNYRGSVAPGQRLWYKLAAAGERAYVEVRGETPLCSVRAALLDARGRTLGQIVSSTRETLPLLVYFPAHAVSKRYYLRIDANPYASCASTDYVFKLVEPEQPEPVECPPPTTGTNGEQQPRSCSAPSKASAVPAFVSRACASYQAAFDRVNRAVAKLRALVARRRARIRALRRLEGVERAARRRANVRCNV